MTQDEHTITLTEKELNFVQDLVDEAISSTDTDRQDKALALQDKLPEYNRWAF